MNQNNSEETSTLFTDSKNLSMEEYVKIHCELNHHIPITYIINGKEVVA
jgi:hypothetical protein